METKFCGRYLSIISYLHSRNSTLQYVSVVDVFKWSLIQLFNVWKEAGIFSVVISVAFQRWHFLNFVVLVALLSHATLMKIHWDNHWQLVQSSTLSLRSPTTLVHQSLSNHASGYTWQSTPASSLTPAPEDCAQLTLVRFSSVDSDISWKLSYLGSVSLAKY